VRFVAVVHPTRGSWLLMSTDLSLSAMEIIRIYGLRFKIALDVGGVLRPGTRIAGEAQYFILTRVRTA
jgi:hypothetical protein